MNLKPTLLLLLFATSPFVLCDQITSQTIQGKTYTCDLTTKLLTYGGSHDDQYVDATIDTFGNIYAAGHTYSTLFAQADQDILLFKFEPQSLTYKKLDGWSLVWGGPLTETATGVATDDNFIYVSGYTNSEGTMSLGGKYDMLLMKVDAQGILQYVKTFGRENNDKINSLAIFKGTVYMVGESDSIGWTSQRTDMTFIKMDATTGVMQGWYFGGSGEDSAIAVTVDTDGMIYSLGHGYSVEFTAGTIDCFLIKYSSTGTMEYLMSFGGRNPDFAADMKIKDTYVMVLGQSQSSELSQGFLDIFITAAFKHNPTITFWTRYIGTPSFSEYAYSLAVSQEGNIFAMGQISATGFTNGNSDILMLSLAMTGETRFVENLGSSMTENPGGLVYSEKTEKITCFATTNQINYNNQGGLDWMVYQLDKKGRNQCNALGIQNQTSNLQFRASNIKFQERKQNANGQNVAFLSIPTIPQTDVTNVGRYGNDENLQGSKLNNPCQKFGPIAPQEALANITVIENTQMTYSWPKFCDDQTEDLTYTLTKQNSQSADQWMLWDSYSRTVTGLVPISQDKLQWFKIQATDRDGMTASANFNISFISKPYLNRAIDNYAIRTEIPFQCTIPRNTFIHPNNDAMTITVDQVPTSWLVYNSRDQSFSGTARSANVGTYTIIVTATDSKNEQTSTSFKIEVQKNYVPVVQKQIDDQQLDLNKTFYIQLERDTFVDPNGDPLTFTAPQLPSWLSFDPSSLSLNGTPSVYGQYNVSVTARDSWNASATMSFEIVAGIKPNTAPVVTKNLTNQQAYLKELFYYQMPTDAFNDSDGDQLFYLVSQTNGSYLPNWLMYEEITKTFSGIPSQDDPIYNASDVTSVLVIADDRRGGLVEQRFNITLLKIDPEVPSYSSLIIVAALMGAFLLVVVGIICKRACNCCNKKSSKKKYRAEGQEQNQEETEDEDSFDEDDDIVILDDARPKNPFKLANPDNYRMFGPEKNLPAHTTMLVKEEAKQ